MSMSSVVALLLIVALAYSEETVKSEILPSHEDPCDVQALISANNANGGKKFHLKVKNNIFLDWYSLNFQVSRVHTEIFM